MTWDKQWYPIVPMITMNWCDLLWSWDILGSFTLLPNSVWGVKRLVYKVDYTRLQKILLFVNDLLKVKVFTL
jgi:hypothetical protein